LRVIQNSHPDVIVDDIGVPWHDGSAIFYRKSKFEVIGEPQRLRFDRANQAALAATFALRASPTRRVTVACTHLKAKLKEGNERIRAEQAHQLTRWLANDAQFARATPIVVAADLNAEPHGAAHRVMTYDDDDDDNDTMLGLRSAYTHGTAAAHNTEPHLSADCAQTRRTLAAALPGHRLLLDDAFERQLLRAEPPFTTAKIRGKQSVMHTIDYVFYTPRRALRVVRLLTLPKQSALPSTLLPGYAFPSDHLHLAVEFAFVDPAEPKSN
jgi:endonuclease/exonuclease/phosphatase family metal-dependent hydrolase